MASNATWAEWFQSEGEKLKERALVDSEKLKERAKEAISKAKEDNKDLIEALQKAKQEAATTLQDGLGDDNLEVVNQVREKERARLDPSRRTLAMTHVASARARGANYCTGARQVRHRFGPARARDLRRSMRDDRHHVRYICSRPACRARLRSGSEIRNRASQICDRPPHRHGLSV